MIPGMLGERQYVRAAHEDQDVDAVAGRNTCFSCCVPLETENLLGLSVGGVGLQDANALPGRRTKPREIGVPSSSTLNVLGKLLAD